MRSVCSLGSFITGTLFIGGAFTAAVVFLPAIVHAQGTVGPQAPAGPSLADGPTQDSKSTLSPPDQMISEAFRKTKSAATADDFSTIVSLCRDGLTQGATGENAAYARKLQAWAQNK